jgi:putative FmdB family regulatory protein
MPIYVYKCKKCGESFEAFRSIHDSDKEVACPGCGTKHPERVIASVYCGSSNPGRGNLTFPT